jgi:beta-lactamase regulating signal transducer with metallopeptidase domain
MNDVGLTLAWLAVQIGLVLGPALVLHALVSRRGPAVGAWVAALSLGLVVILTAAAFLPRRPNTSELCAAEVSQLSRRVPISSRSVPTPDAHTTLGIKLHLNTIAQAWARLEHRASMPVSRGRWWVGVLAPLMLIATSAGVLHLALGLCAIHVCRRRGRMIADPVMTALLEALRGSMECRRAVELREVYDLTTPATAGWWRPLILLPPSWRSWTKGEQRAVLAHELAHIVRGDYIAGLIARLAVALNAFHPLVRWMALRLQMQQELAADALGARYAGGRACYLLALSRLALEQDGRSLCWPARAFLSRPGTLIRRIRMLHDENGTRLDGRAWRVLPTIGLVALTAAVGFLRGPAHADEKVPVHGKTPQAKTTAPLYLRDGSQGVLVIRPDAALRHAGMVRLVPLLTDVIGFDFPSFANLAAEAAAHGAPHLALADVEWVTASVSFGETANADGEKLQTVMAGSPVIRTVAPFDWVAFLRGWRCEVVEVRVEKGVYYKVKGALAALMGPDPCFYLPDDRTMIADNEANIRKLVGVPPSMPAYLRGIDWENASHGLLAIALKNEDDALAKRCDPRRPDDALMLPLLKGVDRWILSVADSDSIVLNASAVCRDRAAREAVVRAVESVSKVAGAAIAEADGDATLSDSEQRSARMLKALMAHLTVSGLEDVQGGNGVPPIDNLVTVHADRFGTLADYAALLDAAAREAMANRPDAKNEPKGIKRSAKD